MKLKIILLKKKIRELEEKTKEWELLNYQTMKYQKNIIQI